MKLLERADLVCRRRGMSRKTAQAYCHWIRRFLSFSAIARGGWTAPAQLGTTDVEAFLNHLVGERHLAASTQNQALNALVFLYRPVLANAIASDLLGKFELLRSARRYGSRRYFPPTRWCACSRRSRASASRGSWRSCCMARACAWANAVSCALEILTSDERKLLSARARGTRTESSCCRNGCARG